MWVRALTVAALTAVAASMTACGSTKRIVVTVLTTPKRATRTSAPTFSAVVARVRTGIVRIEVTTCSGEDIGTGFLVGNQLVATVDHVVNGAVLVTLKQNGKVVADGTVIGSDPARDVALVRTNRRIRGFHFRLATQSPKLGEDVAALGFPLGLPLSFTHGSVSGSDRTIPIEGIDRRNLIQTDAAVNPGNSGGPLITDTGTVVGLIDAATNQANGLGFAVSAQVAQPLLAAWRSSPQPLAAAACAPSPSPTVQALPTTSAPSTSSGAATAAAKTVYTYWSLLQLGDYRRAFNYFTPAEQGRVRGLAEWLKYFRGDPVESVNINVATQSVNGDAATVAVLSLQTVGGATGCRNWSGSYHLLNSPSGWLIDYADLTFTGC